jgi:alpha-galactosidase
VQRDGFREHTVTYTNPAGELSVRCVAVEWRDSPTVEWTLYFKNLGKEDSPTIEHVRAIETTFPSPAAETCTFHYNSGDDCIPQSYEPHAEAMPVGYSKQIANTGGRPTQIAFPYFNFARQSRGAIVVIGWPGQWLAAMGRDDHGIHIAGGQELTHFRLHPGEEVRSPRIVVQFYRGDWIRGQNLWRRWMVLHNMPHPGGKAMSPQALLCTGNFYPGLMSNAKQELAFLKQHIDAGIKFDAWWQDAGWYPCDGVTWPKTGTWEVDRGRFPNRLRDVSDFVHANNRKSIVWFEPERVQEGTWLAENHPEWIHGGSKGGLLKLSEPKCREWLIEHIDKLLVDEAIDIYRQDFNIDPLSYWRAADAEDRQGITEIRHVEGYLAFWDELLRRHPQMYIDSCSSGGRRNDIETMKRAVPLLRSDWYNGTEGQQCHTYGLSLWLPYQGTGAIYPRDRYWFISSMVSSLTFGPASPGVTENDLTIARAMTELHRKMGDCFLGDFYPLTPYTLSADAWIAWQYDQPAKNCGVVQAFRRSQSIFEFARIPLHGLKRDALYAITDLQTNVRAQVRGGELIEQGVPIAIPVRPGAAVIQYQLASPE